MNDSKNEENAKITRLFKAATERFGEDGYSEATMESIAEEAGVSKGTLYYYFDSKEELFMELLFDWMKKFEQLWEGKDFEDSPVRELTQLHTGMIKMVEETASLGRLMLEFWANASRKKKLEEILNNTIKEYRKKTAGIIQRGKEEGVFRDVDPLEASSALIAAYDGLWFHWLLDPESFELKDAGKELISNYLVGLTREDYDLKASMEEFNEYN